jgi:hypothetical protein
MAAAEQQSLGAVESILLGPQRRRHAAAASRPAQPEHGVRRERDPACPTRHAMGLALHRLLFQQMQQPPADKPAEDDGPDLRQPGVVADSSGRQIALHLHRGRSRRPLASMKP